MNELPNNSHQVHMYIEGINHFHNKLYASYTVDRIAANTVQGKI